MSSLLGPVLCPRCRADEFRLEDWETYTSVLCRACGAKMGELFSYVSCAQEIDPSLMPDPVAHPLLGRQVEVTLNRDDGVVVVARGRLLRYSAMGEVVLAEDDGDLHWCWPALDIRPVPGADGGG